MRVYTALFCMLLVPIAVRAQVETHPPNIDIVKSSWSKDRIGWERNPFNATDESFYAMRERVATERRQRSALEERTVRAARAEQKKPPPPPRYVFSYKISVLNSGTEIKEIDWDYVFTDAATGEELGRREFTSVESIGTGKRKELKVLSSAPPTKIISVYTLGNNERDGLVEKIHIVRILYSDDTVWKAP